jgi:hypothetical protein
MILDSCRDEIVTRRASSDTCERSWPRDNFLKGELSQAQAHHRLKGEEQTIAVCEGLRDRIKSFRARLWDYRWWASALDHPGPCRLIPATYPRPPAGTIARMFAEIELLERRKIPRQLFRFWHFSEVPPAASEGRSWLQSGLQ